MARDTIQGDNVVITSEGQALELVDEELQACKSPDSPHFCWLL
jgi:hypothetical protein